MYVSTYHVSEKSNDIAITEVLVRLVNIRPGFQSLSGKTTVIMVSAYYGGMGLERCSTGSSRYSIGLVGSHIRITENGYLYH